MARRSPRQVKAEARHGWTSTLPALSTLSSISSVPAVPCLPCVSCIPPLPCLRTFLGAVSWPVALAVGSRAATRCTGRRLARVLELGPAGGCAQQQLGGSAWSARGVELFQFVGGCAAELQQLEQRSSRYQQQLELVVERSDEQQLQLVQ